MAQSRGRRRPQAPIRPSAKHFPDVNLNLNVRGLPESATLYINERSNRLLLEGRHVYKLGLGQSPFPVPEVVVEELRAQAHQKAYLPVRGLPELRQAITDYMHRTQGLDRGSEGVLIGPGSKELMFLLQLVYYGDLVIPTPSWVSYAPQAQIVGRQIRWVPTSATDGWPLLPRELDEACRWDPGRPRLVVLNYPANPTGQTYDVDALEELAEVARRYRVILLSDEIYGELDHAGGHVSIARFYPEGTIISTGLSKWCGAGGWRLGTFVFPDSLRWLLDAMAVVASETFTSTSAPIQYAAVRAFQGGPEIEDYLDRCRRILRALGRFSAARLREAGASVPEPEGAFYLFPDFAPLRSRLLERGVSGCDALCERLLDDTGVAILPGSAFGRPTHELTARLSYVDFDGGAALEAAALAPGGAELDEAFLRAHCGGVVTAIETLADWLTRD